MPTTLYLIYAAISVFIVAAICFCLVLIVRRFAALVCARENAFPDDFGGFHETIAAHKTEIDEGYALYDSLIKEDVTIRAFDGLSLHGVFAPNGGSKKVLLLVHGYRSSARENFAAVLPFYIERGFALLMIDQRAHGQSEGEYITLGVNEHKDVCAWAAYLDRRFSGDVQIILDGVSMGAATVVYAAGDDLPGSVRGIIADSGFTSPRDILAYLLDAQYHLPAFPLLPMICRRIARLSGADLSSVSAADALKNNRLPILFVHGEDDSFVPVEMSEAAYKLCPSKKTLLTVPGAPHGCGYLVDRPTCRAALDRFFDEVLEK